MKRVLRTAVGLVITGLAAGACLRAGSEAKVADGSCVGRPCGEPCEYCMRDNPMCAEGTALRTCNFEGRCTPEPALCTRTGLPSGLYSPCRAKKCGEPCSMCVPTDADCVPDQQLRQCNWKNLCVPAPAECG